MRSARTLAICLAGAAAVVLVAVGATYLSVDAGSLPSALGKISGSTAHRTDRGFFAVMVGGLVLLVTILASQFRPGGTLATGTGETTAAPDRGQHPEAAAGDPSTGETSSGDAGSGDAGSGEPSAGEAGAVEASGGGGTEYIEEMDDETAADPIIDLQARRLEERRAVDEAGGGESEGFELAEADLIDHTSHGDEHTPSRIMQDAVGPDEESVDSLSGESDAEHLPD
ncbi:MAG TPA: hypothetical protein VG165_00910 [Solirubrobacteraceae bacterium]|nr:hypothetical protein [Solirubrobacteraceae bacterium]